MRMWAITREVQGCGCGLSDAAANALCEHPELRSLRPAALASTLGVSILKAQQAINTVAAIVGSGESIPQGVSLDECFADVGRSARPSQVLFAPNAAGLFAPAGSDAGDTMADPQRTPFPWWLVAVGGAYVLLYRWGSK